MRIVLGENTKTPRVQEKGQVGIRQSPGTTSALISVIHMIAKTPSASVYANSLGTFIKDSAHLLSDFNLQFGKLVNGLLNVEPAEWSSFGVFIRLNYFKPVSNVLLKSVKPGISVNLKGSPTISFEIVGF